MALAIPTIPNIFFFNQGKIKGYPSPIDDPTIIRG